ncbi:hypothetical protein LCGC14_1103320 [marine sediment metagenome]|uniref:InsA N-terminal domain-containing protein n=1 Tax=marine sediment metagenome TaxID=412755 RepID=A0A0F9MWS8_9ZZZZ
MECPRCGSDDVRKLGHIISRRGKKQRYQCINGHTFYNEKDYAIKKGK